MATIEITQTAATVQVGDAVTYTITINKGGETLPITSLYIMGQFPTEMQFNLGSVTIDGVVQPNFDPTVGQDFPDITGETCVITMEALALAVNPSGMAGFAVSYSIGAQGFNEIKPMPIVIEESEGSADLSVKQIALPDPARCTEDLTFIITVKNLGPNSAVNTIVTDITHDEIGNPQVSLDGGATWTSWSGTINLGDIYQNDVATLLLKGVILDAEVEDSHIENTVSVASDTPDLNMSNNVSDITVIDREWADLGIINTVNSDIVQAGSEVMFTMTVTNNGPCKCDSARITNEISGMIPSPEYSFDQIMWMPWTGYINLPLINLGGTLTFYIRGTVESSAVGHIVSTAIVSSDIVDNNQSNNSSTVTLHANENQADIELTLTPSQDTVDDGDELTYTLTATNLGPHDAQNVILQKITPPELTNPMYSVNNSPWQPWQNYFTIFSIAEGQTITVLIRGIISRNPAPAPQPLMRAMRAVIPEVRAEAVPSGIISTTAVGSADTKDPNITNNNASAVVRFAAADPVCPECPICPVIPPPTPSADVSIVMTACQERVCRCGRIEYVITVSNSGTITAENVTINDQLTNYIICPQYSLDGVKSGAWTGSLLLGAMPANTKHTIRIMGKVSKYAHIGIANTATVTSSTDDLNLWNNSSSVVTQVYSFC